MPSHVVDNGDATLFRRFYKHTAKRAVGSPVLATMPGKGSTAPTCAHEICHGIVEEIDLSLGEVAFREEMESRLGGH